MHLSINQAVHHLYSSRMEWYTFPQRLDMTNPYEDACYIGRVDDNVTTTTLTIPSEIHCITNLKCNGTVYRENQPIRPNVFLVCPLRLMIVWEGESRVISYDAMIAKSRISSAL